MGIEGVVKVKQIIFRNMSNCIEHESIFKEVGGGSDVLEEIYLWFNCTKYPTSS